MNESCFLNEFVVLDVTEGRAVSTLRLAAPFSVYSESLDAIITVPEGFEFDGESIPLWLQWLVKPFGLSKRGACVHDYLYRFRGYDTADGIRIPVTRAEADHAYRELVEAKGLPKWRGHLRWVVLRLVGWAAWNSNRRLGL